MNSGSIRLRLLVLAAATIAISLALTWLVLSILFEGHVRARVNVELANQIVWIAANLSADNGQITLTADPPDPYVFDTPRSSAMTAPGNSLSAARSVMTPMLL